MKKIILTLSFCFIGIISTNAQSNDCPSNSTFIQASCVSGCYSVRYNTGTSLDYIAFKPTESQENAIRNDLNRRCSTISGQASIDEPGQI